MYYRSDRPISLWGSVRQVCFGDLWDEQYGLGLPQLRSVGTLDLTGLRAMVHDISVWYDLGRASTRMLGI